MHRIRFAVGPKLVAACAPANNARSGLLLLRSKPMRPTCERFCSDGYANGRVDQAQRRSGGDAWSFRIVDRAGFRMTLPGR
jgi:hypothetical protein